MTSEVNTYANTHVNVCCNNCKNFEKLKKCGNCKGVYYCSRECQKADWPTHKIQCRQHDSAKFTDVYEEAFDIVKKNLYPIMDFMRGKGKGVLYFTPEKKFFYYVNPSNMEMVTRKARMTMKAEMKKQQIRPDGIVDTIIYCFQRDAEDGDVLTAIGSVDRNEIPTPKKK